MRTNGGANPTCALSRFTYHSFTLYLKMTPGGAKELRSGQMLPGQSLSLSVTVSHVYRQILATTIYGCRRPDRHRPILLASTASMHSATTITGLTAKNCSTVH